MANWANIGVGLTGALQGFEQGRQLGQTIKDIRRDRKLEGIRTQGLEAAKGAREKDIQGRIQVTDEGLFRVGDQVIADHASARKAAEAEVDDVMDYYQREVAPKMYEAYIADGDLEKAEAFQKWGEDREVRRGMKHWADGMRAFARGDIGAAAKSFVRSWNTPGYGMGGVKDARPIMDKDGKTTVGLEIEFEDGRVEKLEGEEILRSGILNLTPDKMFDTLYAEQKAADKARIEAAAKARESGIKFQQDVALEGVKQGGREALADRQHRNAVSLAQVKSALDAQAKRAAAELGGSANPILRDYNARVQILMQAGVPEAEARRQAADRTIYRLSMSPQDRVRETMSDLAKNDLRFTKLPQEEQIRRVRETIAAEDALVREITGGAGLPSASADGGGADDDGIDAELPWFD